MSTFLPKADEITRNWYVIDAAGKPLGRVASEAAVLLRGKHKPIFTPNVDCGDFVIIINTDKAVLTGDKLKCFKTKVIVNISVVNCDFAGTCV